MGRDLVRSRGEVGPLIARPVEDPAGPRSSLAWVMQERSSLKASRGSANGMSGFREGGAAARAAWNLIEPDALDSAPISSLPNEVGSDVIRTLILVACGVIRTVAAPHMRATSRCGACGNNSH